MTKLEALHDERKAWMTPLHDAAPELLEALIALAKAQYDGTIEGLRSQMETEDWGDILAIAEVKAAYELTLAAIAKATGCGHDPDM